MKKLAILGVCIGLLTASFQGMNVHAAELNKEETVATWTAPEMDVNPIVVLDSYSMDTSSIVYGNDYNLHLVFQNESKLADATNILVSYGSPNQSVIPTYGEVSKFYIDEIKAGEVYEMDLPICIISSTSGYVQMQFDMEYTANQEVYDVKASNITFKVSSGSSRVVLEDVTEETEETVTSVPETTTGTNQVTVAPSSSNTGLDSSTIIMGIGVIVIILGLFGLIFGRKK